ncbi:MAG: Zn-dependent alcohol dehydrogenase [Dehalococcoidia bacterium]|jgi:Zn-dependent alcohol dehydrogenase
MKAAVFYGANQPLAIEEVDIASPKRGEVLVKIAASGLCHTDLHFMEGFFPWPAPAVLGHEAAGVVEQVGEGVNSVQPGDHVVLSSAPSCGVCRYCVAGKPYLCTAAAGSHQMRDGTSRLALHDDGKPLFHFLGVSSFAEYAVVSELAMAKVRDDAPLQSVSLVGCAVATGVGAVLYTAGVTAGKSVAVFGCGGVGLNVVQGANLVGACPIIAIDTKDEKLALAKQFGATHVVNPAKEHPVLKVHEITGGGADFAFEAIGDVDVLGQAFDSLDRGGMAVMAGVPPFGSKYAVDTMNLFNDKTLRGCVLGSVNIRRDFPMLVDLYMAKRLKLDELMTRTFPLEAINEAFELVKRGEVARAVVTF